MMINQAEGEDASKSTRLIYPKTVKSLVKIKKKQNMFENYVILVNTGWRFPLSGLKIKTITQANLLRGVSTHYLSLKDEAEAKAQDKFKVFYFKLIPFVSP